MAVKVMLHIRRLLLLARCRFGRAPFAGSQMIVSLFGTFWPSPDGQGRLLKINIVTWEYTRYNPSKGESRPAIHKEFWVEREGRREGEKKNIKQFKQFWTKPTSINKLWSNKNLLEFWSCKVICYSNSWCSPSTANCHYNVIKIVQHLLNNT